MRENKAAETGERRGRAAVRSKVVVGKSMVGEYKVVILNTSQGMWVMMTWQAFEVDGE